MTAKKNQGDESLISWFDLIQVLFSFRPWVTMSWLELLHSKSKSVSLYWIYVHCMKKVHLLCPVEISAEQLCRLTKLSWRMLVISVLGPCYISRVELMARNSELHSWKQGCSKQTSCLFSIFNTHGKGICSS